MSLWPAWDRATNPGALAGYAQREVTRRLLPADLASALPGTGGAGTLAEKARALYETFARVGIRYVAEPTLSDAGGQRVRTSDQVLARPRQGTCVDLAIAYAGACLDAGLHPVVVVLDPRHHGGSAHAVVLVWLDGTWPHPAAEYPLGGEVHTVPPTTRDGVDLLEEIRTSPGGSGGFLPVDVTGATWRDAASGASKDWDTAVTDAAAMLHATEVCQRK